MYDPRLGSDVNMEETGKHSHHMNEINAVAATLVERCPSSCDSEVRMAWAYLFTAFITRVHDSATQFEL